MSLSTAGDVANLVVAGLAAVALVPVGLEFVQRVRLRRIDVALTMIDQYRRLLRTLPDSRETWTEAQRHDVISHIDQVGYLVRTKQLDRNLAWQKFFTDTCSYIELWGAEVRQQQDDQDDPTLWEDLFWLQEELREFDQKMIERRRRKPLTNRA